MFILISFITAYYHSNTVSFYQICSRDRTKHATVLHRRVGKNTEQQNGRTEQCIRFDHTIRATDFLLVIRHTLIVSFIFFSSSAIDTIDR